MVSGDELLQFIELPGLERLVSGLPPETITFLLPMCTKWIRDDVGSDVLVGSPDAPFSAASARYSPLPDFESGHKMEKNAINERFRIWNGTCTKTGHRMGVYFIGGLHEVLSKVVSGF